jgi:hypothetical protein
MITNCHDCHKPVDIKDAYFVKIRDSMRCIPVAICPDCVPKHKGRKTYWERTGLYSGRKPPKEVMAEMEE